MNNVTPFPLLRVLEWRAENRRTAEINAIDEQIAANEREMARLAHVNWLLKLEKEGLSHG